MSKSCQNCKQAFVIEPEDFEFYAKVQVPPPTFCPPCRLIRRLAWRNEKKLFRRTCNLTGKKILSVFADSVEFPVYEAREWFSDAWDPMQYGEAIDWNQSFFEQFYKLSLRVPRPNLMVDYPSLVNSDYANYIGHSKNCYLVSEGDFNDTCAHASSLKHSREAYDILLGRQLEQCYECIYCERCHTTFFSEDCEDCLDVWFSKNLVGCSNCIGCANLRKVQYYIFNESYSKEAYEEKVRVLGFGTRQGLTEIQKRAFEVWLAQPQRYYHGRHNTNSVGDYISYSKNAYRCNEAIGVEDSKFCNIISLKPVRECYDYTEWGNNAELLYECLTVGEGASRVRFANFCLPDCRDIEYSMFCRKSANLFGCTGLKNKQFCILNKQYQEAEYWDVRARLIEHMNAMPYLAKNGAAYRYGEFFPIEFSPYAYNDTNAQDFFPMSKDEAEHNHLIWRDSLESSYSVTVFGKDVPDTISVVTDDILSQIIECASIYEGRETCSRAFRIIPQELAFYRAMNLPLPNACPGCRHYARIEQRNSLIFSPSACQCSGSSTHTHGIGKCSETFETCYRPSHRETLYCETCYLAEVV